MANPIPLIDPAELHQELRQNAGVLLDVRSPNEYIQGHIPGARLAPLDSISPKAVESLMDGTGKTPGNHTIYLTCQAGLRAEQARKTLSQQGVQNLVLLNGGTEAWLKAGLPVESCKVPLSLEQQFLVGLGLILILKVIIGFTLHEAFFIIGAVLGAALLHAGFANLGGVTRLMARLPWNRNIDCVGRSNA